MKNIVLIVSIILTLTCGAVFAQTTEFTYQGSLKDGANPASGSYDFQFALFDAGGGLNGFLAKNNVAVANGLFSVKLDFGNLFPGANRFLEIRVRQTGGGAFTVLAPRQQVTTSPYSITSLNSAQLGGLTSGGFIQNTTSPQSSSNFNITGTGIVQRLIATENAFIAGNVGIGTDAPQQTLHVVGSEILSTGNASGFKFRDRGSASSADDWVWYSNGNIARFFRAGTGDLMSVQTNGNVGVGTVSPGEKLSVNGKIQSTSGGFKFPDGSLQTTAVGTTFTNPRTAAVEIPINGTPASILHLDLPAGTYMVTATVQFRNNANVFGQNNSRVWFCRMFQDTNFDQAYVFTLAGADTPANILSTTVHSIVPLSSASSVDFKCHGSAAGGQNFVFADQRRLTAVKIEGNVIVQ